MTHVSLDEQVIAVVSRLYERRRRLSLTQAAVAELMGTSQSTVSHLETGRRHLMWGHLERYAAALGGEIRVELVFDSDEG